LKNRILKSIEDIVNCINEIDVFFEPEGKKFELFYTNKLLRKAIERNLEIIGESANRIRNADDSISITNIKQIINLRNLIIHSYDNINYEVIWAIVINDLPKLKTEIVELKEKIKNA
jgi:uncharacterized protein with HEPN domain